jgi:hypothetical protein
MSDELWLVGNTIGKKYLRMKAPRVEVASVAGNLSEHHIFG